MKSLLMAAALAMMAMSNTTLGAEQKATLPPGESGAKEALNQSPRHGEWVEITVPTHKTPLKAFVVYPQVEHKVPVVIVIHEIFGLTDWVRSVADQLAADGFIAIAPDLLSGHGPNGLGSDGFGSRDDVVRAVRDLKADEVTDDLNAVREYGLKLSAANDKTATIGFCWGGGQSFAYAAAQPKLNAAIVYYGTPPAADQLKQIQAAVAGFYGKDDARITLTVPATSTQMQQQGKTYVPHVYEGAGHGFLRAQDGQNGANAKAAERAWPATIAFLREHTK